MCLLPLLMSSPLGISLAIFCASLSRRLEREHVLVLDLVWVMLGQKLLHGVLLVIGLDLLFMAVNPRSRAYADNPISSLYLMSQIMQTLV